MPQHLLARSRAWPAIALALALPLAACGDNTDTAETPTVPPPAATTEAPTDRADPDVGLAPPPATAGTTDPTVTTTPPADGAAPAPDAGGTIGENVDDALEKTEDAIEEAPHATPTPGNP